MNENADDTISEPVVDPANASPDWLMQADSELACIFEQIEAVCQRIQSKHSGDRVFSSVDTTTLHEKFEPLVDNDQIDLDTMTPKSDTNVPEVDEEWALIQINMQGDLVRLFSVFVASRLMAVINLAISLRENICAGNLLVGMIGARALIEHISLFEQTIAELRQIEIDDTGRVEDNVVSEATTQLRARCFPRSIDWQKLVQNPSVTKKNHIKYEVKPCYVDQSVEQILNLVDRLDKLIKGTRVAYEILSEFAHPNVGVVLAVTRSINKRTDTNGAVWQDETLSLDPPIGIVETLREPFRRIFLVINTCLEHFEKLIDECPKIQSSLLLIAQRRVCQYLPMSIPFENGEKKISVLLKPYELCPCASGDKFKFCCKNRESARAEFGNSHSKKVTR